MSMEIADFRHNPEKIALLTDSCACLLYTSLPEKFQTAWNDVLAAQVCWIRQGAYGPEIVLAGVDPQRVYDFSFMPVSYTHLA